MDASSADSWPFFQVDAISLHLCAGHTTTSGLLFLRVQVCFFLSWQCLTCVVSHREFRTTAYLLKGAPTKEKSKFDKNKKVNEDEEDEAGFGEKVDEADLTEEEREMRLLEEEAKGPTKWIRFPQGIYKQKKGVFDKAVLTLTSVPKPPEPEPGDVYAEDSYNHAVLKGECYAIPPVKHEFAEEMFKQIRKRRDIEEKRNPKPPSTSAYAGEYRLMGSVIMQRLPTLTREKEQWEIEYEKFRHERDLERSREPFLWDGMRNYIHEQVTKGGGGAAATGGGGGGGNKKDRKKKDKQKDKAKPTEETKAETQTQQPTKTTEEEAQLTPEQIRAIRQETEWLEFWKNWQPAPRETQADKDNDRKSLDRALDKSLYLIVKKNRKDHAWQLPQTDWRHGETMRGVSYLPSRMLFHSSLWSWKNELTCSLQTVEREVKEDLGAGVVAYFISNAPCGVYNYNYAKEAQDKYKSESAKVCVYTEG